MKKIVILLLTVWSVSAFAQDIKVPSSLVVSERAYALDGAERNGFDILLQGEAKDILKAWTKYMSDKYDLKLKSKGTTANGVDFNNASWSDKQFSIKSAVVTDVQGPHLRVWMLFGADVFASSAVYAAETNNVKTVMKEFSKSYYVAIFEDQLKDQEKAVSSQGKEVSSLAKDKAKTDKAISKAESKIEKAEKNKEKAQEKIQKLEKEISSADKDIKEYRETIASKKGTAGKTAEELVKEESKFENFNQDQEAIKSKIKAIQAL